MPVDMVLHAKPTPSSLSDSNKTVSSSDVTQFQKALQQGMALEASAETLRVSDQATAAAAAESMGIGENDKKKKESLVERMSTGIEAAFMDGSDQLQGFYKHVGAAAEAKKLTQGPAVLSLQMELMRATVLIDILTKVANKAATTIDSMIRLQ